MLVVYIDSCLEQYAETKYLFTEKTDENVMSNLKNTCQTHLQSVIWSTLEFKDIWKRGGGNGDKRGVEAHSIRELSATFASN